MVRVNVHRGFFNTVVGNVVGGINVGWGEGTYRTFWEGGYIVSRFLCGKDEQLKTAQVSPLPHPTILWVGGFFY